MSFENQPPRDDRPYVRPTSPEIAETEAVRYLSVADKVFPETYGGLPGHRPIDRLLKRTIDTAPIHARVDPRNPENVARVAAKIENQHPRESAILLAMRAEDRDEAVGMAYFLYGQIQGTGGHWYDGEIVEVNVVPEERGQRIAADLLHQGLQPLLSADLRQPTTVRWDVVEGNTIAEDFYRKLGAEPTGGKISVELFDGTPNVQWIEYAMYADELDHNLKEYLGIPEDS
jgi:GNAT superfamily N-acetyltransferase